MKHVLLGLLAIGWLACAVEEPASSSQPELSEATEALASTPEPVEAPPFNQCLRGWACVPETQCSGPISSRPVCGVALYCCPEINPQ